MTGQHFLIVHDEPDDGMEVEHPAGCPTDTIYDFLTVHACDVGRVAWEDGPEEYFRRVPEEDDKRQYTPPGRYEIEYWIDVVQASDYGTTEVRDVGLRLVEGGAT